MLSSVWLRMLVAAVEVLAMTAGVEAQVRVTISATKEKSLDQLLVEKIRCARDLVYTEARGESEYGQMLVIWTVIRRMSEKRPEWSGSFCDNVYRIRFVKERMVSQYAGPIHKPVTLRDDDPELVKIAQLAIRVLLGYAVVRPEHRCVVAYQRPEHADARNQGWFSTLNHLGRIGRHNFYCLPSPQNVAVR